MESGGSGISVHALLPAPQRISQIMSDPPLQKAPVLAEFGHAKSGSAVGLTQGRGLVPPFLHLGSLHMPAAVCWGLLWVLRSSNQ